MAINPDNHTFDEHGFAIDKTTGHRVGLEAAPLAAPAEASDFPKWIVPHESHVVRKSVEGGAPDHVSTPAFAEFHVNRVTGEVTVLVVSAEEEEKALASYVAPGEPDDRSDEPAPAELNGEPSDPVGALDYKPSKKSGK